MSTQKFITYNVLDSKGQLLKDKYELKLNVNEEFGNYLIHKTISKHKIQANPITDESHDICNNDILPPIFSWTSHFHLA